MSALIVHDGFLVAGGRFSTAGGIEANGIAFWDGSSWQPLGGGMSGGMPTGVSALAIYNGDLIAAGNFTSAGGVSANHIARWDGSSWHPLGGGLSTWASALTVYNGDLIVGGQFVHASSVSGTQRIARWDGSSWHPLGSGMDQQVAALTVHNEHLIAGGAFTSAGGVEADHIAQWNGIEWQPMNSGMNFEVRAFTGYENDLIAGGNFLTASGQPARRVARWDGSSWQPLGDGLGGVVHALTVYDGNIIAGIGVTETGWQPVNAWNGSLWKPLGTMSENPNLRALAVHDSRLIAGGGFTIVNGLPGNRIASWNDCPEPAELTVTIHEPASGMLAQVNEPILFAGEFTPTGISGQYQAFWTFSSGTLEPFSVEATVEDTVVLLLLPFAEPGVYNIQLTVIDPAGTQATATTVQEDLPAYIVVHDPDGGFVTGGGWIYSHAGAFYDPDLAESAQAEGRASFGFVSRYRPGATVPTGNTQFQFRAGHLNFHSTEYQWLVVAGARAQFKGWGTINQEGPFAFLLTGIDGSRLGQAAPDRFRIKIWNEESEVVIYDNQRGADDNEQLDEVTILGGGSIVIHNPPPGHQ